MKSNLHHPVAGDVDQFDIPAVVLYRRPDEAEHLLNPVMQVGLGTT